MGEAVGGPGRAGRRCAGRPAATHSSRNRSSSSRSYSSQLRAEPLGRQRLEVDGPAEVAVEGRGVGDAGEHPGVEPLAGDVERRTRARRRGRRSRVCAAEPQTPGRRAAPSRRRPAGSGSSRRSTQAAVCGVPSCTVRTAEVAVAPRPSLPWRGGLDVEADDVRAAGRSRVSSGGHARRRRTPRRVPGAWMATGRAPSLAS